MKTGQLQSALNEAIADYNERELNKNAVVYAEI